MYLLKLALRFLYPSFLKEDSFLFLIVLGPVSVLTTIVCAIPELSLSLLPAIALTGVVLAWMYLVKGFICGCLMLFTYVCCSFITCEHYEFIRTAGWSLSTFLGLLVFVLAIEELGRCYTEYKITNEKELYEARVDIESLKEILCTEQALLRQKCDEIREELARIQSAISSSDESLTDKLLSIANEKKMALDKLKQLTKTLKDGNYSSAKKTELTEAKEKLLELGKQEFFLKKDKFG